nr:ribonuclease H-like domain-containing protein [Tanacetum cinerariifolium]
MWNDLKETYDTVDGSGMFNLHKSINSLSQNDASLAEYYNNMNSLSKQFDAMINLPPCTCEAAKYFDKHNQLIKLMNFLMGLDESYLAIRSNILTSETLPLIMAAFVIISGEESHRNVTSVGATKPATTTFALSLLVILLVQTPGSGIFILLAVGTPSTGSGNSFLAMRMPLKTPSSGISILLAVGTPSTGSGNLYRQWELSPGSENALCILFPTRKPYTSS